MELKKKTRQARVELSAAESNHSFEEVYHSTLGSHGGVEKTHHAVSSYNYRPGAEADCVNWCDHNDTNSNAKTHKHKCGLKKVLDLYSPKNRFNTQERGEQSSYRPKKTRKTHQDAKCWNRRRIGTKLRHNSNIYNQQLKRKLDTGEHNQTMKLVGQEVGRSEMRRRGEG